MRFIFNQLRFSRNNAGHRPSESAVGDLGEAEAAEKDKVKLANLMSLAINFYPAHLQNKKKMKKKITSGGLEQERTGLHVLQVVVEDGRGGVGGGRRSPREQRRSFGRAADSQEVSGANVGSECVTSLSVCSD